MPTDATTDLLNKVSAVTKAKIASFKTLSSDTGICVTHLYDMVNMRRYRPNGKNAALLHEWAARKSNQIAALPREVQCRYREHYRANCKRFPAEGRKS